MKLFLNKCLLISLLIIAFGLFIFGILFPTGYEYVELQPNFLITILQGTDGEHLNILLEADFVHGCTDDYDLRAESDVSDNILIKIDGLYKKRKGFLNSCRPSGWRRPVLSLGGGIIEEGMSKDLIFTINDKKIGDRMNKYTISRIDNKFIIEPKFGGFTSITAYQGMAGLEKYSEKYDYKAYSGGQVQLEGKSYFAY